MTFQFYNPAPVLWELNPIEPAAGGSIQFYSIGTTTPKNTWSDFARTTLNANPVTLDSAGRPSVPLWLDGDYSVTLRDSDGVTIDTFDLRDPATGGTTIPSLVSGRFLTNNGTSLSWATIRQLPDPTGQGGKVVTTDGANFLFTNLPAAPTLPITVRTNGVSIGDGTKTFRILTGSATGVNAGGRFQTVSVTFPITFTTVPTVTVQLSNASAVSSFSNNPSSRVSSVTTTGFTVVWTMGELDDAQAGFNFNAAVQFAYTAMGEATA